jgi:hypothetical protein
MSQAADTEARDKYVLTTQWNERHWSKIMCEQGSPYKIHAKGCQGIIQYREEVWLSAPTINDLECLTWSDQILEGSMTKESVKGTVHICPCAVGV